MMVMKKTNFDITSYLSKDPEYGQLWESLLEEFERTRKNLLIVSQMGTLMEGNPKDLLSVDIREKIMLPLCIIHQFALLRLNHLKNTDPESDMIEKYTHMIIRSSYGIINASRNSA
jgi:phosphoenolpyruvate carboxylase